MTNKTQSSIKIYEQDLYLFYLLIGCHATIFEALFREQSHLLNVNHCVAINFLPRGYLEAGNKVGSLSLAESLVRLELGTFQKLFQKLFKRIFSNIMQWNRIFKMHLRILTGKKHPKFKLQH